MPKRQSHRRRKSGGGWFDGTPSTNTYPSTSTYNPPNQSSSGSSWWNSLMGTSTMNTIPMGTSTMNTGMGTASPTPILTTVPTAAPTIVPTTVPSIVPSASESPSVIPSATPTTSTMNSYDSNYDPMRGKRPMGNQIVTQRSFGGRTRGRKMKGGYKDNISTTDLAAHAAPFSGPTAQPHNLVGGRTRRRGKKGGRKSCKKGGKTYRNRK